MESIDNLIEEIETRRPDLVKRLGRYSKEIIRQFINDNPNADLESIIKLIEDYLRKNRPREKEIHREKTTHHEQQTKERGR